MFLVNEHSMGLVIAWHCFGPTSVHKVEYQSENIFSMVILSICSNILFEQVQPHKVGCMDVHCLPYFIQD